MPPYSSRNLEVTAITPRVDIAWTIHESEEALMIIINDVLFGIVGIIFQLTEWIAIVTKSSEEVSDCNDMLGFSYLAIPTRHEVPGVPYVHEKIMNEK